MKTQPTQITTEFGPDTWFELSPAPPKLFRAVQESRFERLKRQLLTERLATAWDPDFGSHLRRAANEAAALAWTTRYPLLVFPVLFEEKVADAEVRIERQAEVRRRSRELLAL